MAAKKPKRPSLTLRERGQVVTAIENKKKRAKSSGRPLTAKQISTSRKTIEASILRRRKK